MNRRKQREQAFYLIFQSQFNEDDSQAVALYSEYVEPLGDWAVELYEGVKANRASLDEAIAAFSNGWRLSRISKVNLSILRLALYELKFEPETPPSVVINEAVELAKKYSGKEDSSFINGVLGAYLRSTASCTSE